jgi:solute carrier family 25 (mitochondrial thiamine pyrophosphate transporter), member 19
MTLQHCKHIAIDHGLASHSVTPFLSGALAGAAGTVASYPFDLLRTTLAAQGEPKVYAGMLDATRGIIQENGVRGLYRGMGITVLEIMPYAALQFGLYDVFNSFADEMRRGKRSQKLIKNISNIHNGGRKGGHSNDNISEIEPLPASAFQSFVCGLAAGTLAKLGTHPLDVVKKRFQVAGLQRSARYGERVSSQVAASFLMCIQSIAQKEGLGGFYKGAMPSLLKAAPSAAVTFACYDFFLRTLTARNQEKKAVAAAAAAAVKNRKLSAPGLH